MREKRRKRRYGVSCERNVAARSVDEVKEFPKYEKLWKDIFSSGDAIHRIKLPGIGRPLTGRPFMPSRRLSFSMYSKASAS